MPVKYSGSSDDLSPSLPSRLVRKVSNSVGTFRVRKRTRFERRSDSDHLERGASRRDSVANGTGRDRRSLRRISALNTDGSHDSGRQVSEESVAAGTNTFRRRRRSHTLETVQEVPSGQTSRRTTIVDSSNSESKEPRQAASHSTPAKLRVQHSSACSDMHQSVKSGDYLLARGANPRTGVVTPYHSASSSLDDHSTTQVPRRPPRWRQNGDQWISLDLGEPTPSSTAPSMRFPESQQHGLRTPHKLVSGRHPDSLRGSSAVQNAIAPDVPSKPGVTFRISQPPRERNLTPTENQEALDSPLPQLKLQFDTQLKRKPVGSTSSRSLAEPSAHYHDGSEDSTATVLRKPVFNDDVRSSSAPVHVRGDLYNPQFFNKDLPKLPRDSSTLQSQIITPHDPFLGPRETDQPVNVPISNTFSISGLQAVEKELPCLPTSNGPFQSTSTLSKPPHPFSPTKETKKGFENRQEAKSKAPQGPRDGGNPGYPYIRTARPTYPILLPPKDHQPIGERVMPVPVYDNPPTHHSLLERIPGALVEGPRSMPRPEMSVPERTRLALAQLLNTTTTPTGMSTSTSSIPRPPQIGPRSTKVDLGAMKRGHRGLLQRPPPLARSDIIMNTDMSMTTDTMMSIPMPRIRPRAMPRPAMPTRAEGMYGIPKIDLSSERYNTADIELQQPSMPTDIRQISAISSVQRGPIMMPEPLKTRQTSHDHTITEESGPNHAELKSNGCGLMRKCSRCNHGFVDVKLHDIDSVILTSDLQKDVVEANEAIEQTHPCRSPLPGVPEDSALLEDEFCLPNTTILSHQKEETDERDHTICCPRCCQMDCHEGCLGHPSPTSSPGPDSNIWSEVQTPSIGSEASTLVTEENAFEVIKIPKARGLNLVKSALKKSPKKDQGFNFVNHIQAALTRPSPELVVQPPTPVKNSVPDALHRQSDAVAAARSASKPSVSGKPNEALPAAVSAILSAQRKVSTTRPSMHKRQRSSSLPTVGLGITSRSASLNTESSRAVSGSRLRIPSPISFVLSCAASKNGASRSRNVSGTSVNTIEVQLPSLGSYNALSEIFFVPFEATKMWIQTHPQILTMSHEGGQRAWEMAQIMMKTAWRAWAVIFVYSKTGKIKFNAKKGETARGFLMDVARSLLYFFVFAAIGAVLLRAVGLVLGVLRMGMWFFKAVFWMVRGILGVGAAK